MKELDQQVRTVLKTHNYSLTHPRSVVFNALLGQEPLTMIDLVKRCAGIDRASVYRTVALFEKLGVIQRLQIGWKYKLELSDQYAPHHHHLTCMKCGKVIALPEDSLLEKYLNKMSVAKNFRPLDHQVEIRGLCQLCQASSK